MSRYGSMDHPEPSRTRVTPLVLSIVAVAASLALGVVAAAIFGGTAWIGALLLLGAAIGWSLLEHEVALERGFGDDSEGRRRRLIPTVVIVTAMGAAGVIVVGAVAGYL